MSMASLLFRERLHVPTHDYITHPWKICGDAKSVFPVIQLSWFVV